MTEDDTANAVFSETCIDLASAGDVLTEHNGGHG
jgi:hypothetical protein